MLHIPNLILTNSAGCVNLNWGVGDIMIVNGHLDFTFKNSSPTIINTKNIYKEKNLQIAKDVAQKLNMNLREGVYTWTLGPTYETPAEIKMIREIGGDVVGMSTLPEITEAGRLNLNLWTFSCLTNMAAGVSKGQLTHQEVLLNADKHKERFKIFIEQINNTIRRNFPLDFFCISIEF